LPMCNCTSGMRHLAQMRAAATFRFAIDRQSGFDAERVNGPDLLASPRNDSAPVQIALAAMLTINATSAVL
jgi:hypothetical protein